jgi:hypothetical protein
MAKKIKDIDKIARDYANKEYPQYFEMPDDNWQQRAGYVKGFKAGAKWEDEILTNKAIEWFKDNFICLPPDFESMFREAMKKSNL